MPDYNYSNLTNRWRDATTGQFVSETVVINEMRLHQQATYSTLENLTNSLYSGQISVSQWQIGIASELKDAHLAQSIFAVGGKANMTAANYGRVGGVLADEYRYLTRFAQQIANGQISQAQALARIRQYGNATQQSYYREYAQATPDNEVIHWDLNPAEHCGDCLDLNSGSPYTSATLPTVPGAGNTQCRGNCKCTLRREAA